MPLNIKNLAYIRSHDPKLAEALDSIANAHSSVESQVNGSSLGQPLAPPAANRLNVTAANGHFSAAITDHNDVYRGVQYYIEHADNPGFQNPIAVHLGDSRNWDKFLGNSTRYFRAFSSYASSPSSSPVYHGSAGAPSPVFGGGNIPGPAFQSSQGSGTGSPGQGLSGPGNSPFRSSTGRAPIRGTIANPQGSGVSSIGLAGPANSGALALGGNVTFMAGGVAVPPLFDTYANWTVSNYSPINYPTGTTFNISDWNNTIYRVQLVGGVNKWVYFAGVYQTLQASIPTTGFNGALLGLNDTNLQVNVTDYAHLLQWGGVAWKFAFGDSSGYIVDAISTPNGGKWQACDGSTVNVLQAGGSLASVTTPNWNGQDAFEISTGTHAAGSSTPASPGITGNESATHTHPVGTLAGSGTATVGTTTVNAGTGSPATVGAGGAAPVSVTISGSTGPESATHTHIITAPTEAVGGLPKRIAFLKYLRQ